MRRQMAEMPFYSVCARQVALSDHECSGVNGEPFFRLTWEHAMIHGSKKVQEIWAIIPLCPLVHLGNELNKEINQWIALSRATDEEIEKYPRTDWVQRRGYLVQKYGIFRGYRGDIGRITSGEPVEKVPLIHYASATGRDIPIL